MQIALFGSYGQGNIGDEAIADGLAYIFQTIDPSCKLILFSHQSPALQDKHPAFSEVVPMIASGVRSFLQQWQNGTWRKNKTLIGNSDWVVIGGGGIFHDQEIAQRGFSPLFIWWLRTLLFKYLRKRIAIATVGIGPINSTLSKIWLKGILKRADIITVRDHASQQLAHTVTSKMVTILPDPVWGLFTSVSLPSLPTQGTLGINVRENHRFDIATLLSKITTLITEIQTVFTIKDIHLIPFALHQPDDRELMKTVAEYLRSHYSVPVSITSPTSSQEAFKIVAACQYFIASRFHSYIFAESAQIPCKLISYSSKTDEITKYSRAQYIEQQKNALEFWRVHLFQ